MAFCAVVYCASMFGHFCPCWLLTISQQGPTLLGSFASHTTKATASFSGYPHPSKNSARLVALERALILQMSPLHGLNKKHCICATVPSLLHGIAICVGPNRTWLTMSPPSLHHWLFCCNLVMESLLITLLALSGSHHIAPASSC